eukprot:TRINITY_DN10252_c0_g1_i4.p1 TRINITY_DN10252_c0_g1~~TRINITY_DN10252_c0_g1_i4.p1  ORF type:complete len:184 (-),score=11.61 TRINITY_DN10252_c0_g1_i4:117-668(-)
MNSPLRFSWVEEGIAGMAIPKTVNDILFLHEQNVGLLVTLTKECRLNSGWFDGTNVSNLYIPIEDFRYVIPFSLFIHLKSIPTLSQVNTFVSNVEQTRAEGKAVAVHCWGGMGRYLSLSFDFYPQLPFYCRTGTMLACWLVYKNRMDPDSAVSFVRNKRPGSLETKAQVRLVHQYDVSLKISA